MGSVHFVSCVDAGLGSRSESPVPNAQVQKPVLSEENALKNVPVDESSGVATGVLPDLTIKEMCLASTSANASEIRFLLFIFPAVRNSWNS